MRASRTATTAPIAAPTIVPMLLFAAGTATAADDDTLLDAEFDEDEVRDDDLEDVEDVRADDELPDTVEAVNSGGTAVEWGLLLFKQVVFDDPATVNSGVLPPVPIGPSSDMSRRNWFPAAISTGQFSVRADMLGTGISHAVPPGTIPYSPTGLRAFSFHCTFKFPHCDGFDVGATQK